MSNMGINPKAFGKLMRMLAQYNDAPSAVIREYVSNAVDAVTGMEDGHVEVVFPTEDNPTLIVSDNGVGMTEEFMTTELGNYLTSTKSEDGSSIGSKGIGSKAAFSISDEFSITSRRDGRRTTCVYHITDDDECWYDSTVEDDVENGHGTVVSIDIKNPHDISRLRLSGNVLRGFPRGMLTVIDQNGNPIGVDWFDGMYRIDINDNVSIDLRKLISTSYGNSTSIMQGNVFYDSNSNSLLDKAFTRSPSLKNMITSYASGEFPALVIRVPGNTLTTNPSREQFESTDANIDVIMHALKSITMDDIARLHDTINDKEYMVLSYDDAISVYDGLCALFRKFSVRGERFIGGHDLWDSTLTISDDEGTVYYRPRHGGFTRVPSPYQKFTIPYDNGVRKGDGVLVVHGMNDDDINGFIKHLRLWSRITDSLDGNDFFKYYKTIVFTDKPIDDVIPYWYGRKSVITEVDKSGIDDEFAIHAAELKANRVARNGARTAPVEKKVSTITIGCGNPRRLTFREIEDFAQSPCHHVFRIDGDDYMNVTSESHEIMDRLRRLNEQLSLDDNMSLYSSTKMMVIRDYGSKKVRNHLHEHYDDVRDYYDYKSPNIQKFYDKTMDDYESSELVRLVDDNVMRPYSYWDRFQNKDINILEIIASKMGDDAPDCIRTIAGFIDKRNELAARYPTANMDDIDTILSYGAIPRDNRSFMRMMAPFDNAVSDMKSRFPLLKLITIDKMRDNMDVIIDYLRLFDRNR